MIEIFQNGQDIHWNTVLNELERYVGQADLVIDTARRVDAHTRALGFAEAVAILREIGPDRAIAINPLWKELRKKAKAVGFGYLFGMQWKKFKAYARDNYDMVITDEEAQQSRRAFFDLYPLERWHQMQKANARMTGYVRSIAGRKRRLPDAQRNDDSYEEGEALRQAINSPVQSFANDINLMVLLQMCEEFDPTIYQPVATIHDAILAEVRTDHVSRVARRITEIMTQPRLFKEFGINLRVPICGDVKIGAWGKGISLEQWEQTNESTSQDRSAGRMAIHSPQSDAEMGRRMHRMGG
jgi:DNA polymerase family A